MGAGQRVGIVLVGIRKTTMKVIRISRLFLLFLVLLTGMATSCIQSKERSPSFIPCNNGTKPMPLDQATKLPGSLLFTTRQRTEIFALDGETHEIISLATPISPEQTFRTAVLTPDGNSLVISQIHSQVEKELMVQLVSSDGSTKVQTASFEERFVETKSNFSWNPTLWINESLLQGYISSGNYEEPGINILFDPFQGKWINLTQIFDIPDAAQESGFSISPDLSRVLYVDDQFHLVLYDQSAKHTLWEYTEYDGINPDLQSVSLREAAWSQDGTMLATPISIKSSLIPGIMILNKDGKVVNLLPTGVRSFGLSWSHNQLFIAFFENRCTTLDCIGNLIPVIRLYSVKDSLVYDQCLLAGETVPVANIQNQKIVWSPDDRFIAYGFWSSTSYQNGIIIQELGKEQVKAFAVDGKDLIFLGWSEYSWK